MVLSTLDTIDECRLQIETLPIHLLVLNLTEVKEISEEALRPLTLIQSIVRRSNITLRVCGLSEELTTFLLNRGAIRKTEMFKSLLEALKTLEVKQAA
jgi:hypothetical protein